MNRFLFGIRHFTFILISLMMIFYGNHFVNLKKESPRIYPTPEMKRLTLAYPNLYASFLWIAYLQEPDFCENSNVLPTYNPGQNLEEILSYKLKASRCHLGWTYQVLNTITEINPRFYPAYLMGGTMLSVAVDDRFGAKAIFDKGLKVFPDDWNLHYRAAYLYIYELQDPERAIELLNTAYKNGGPEFIPSLIARLYTRMGQALLGITVLEDFIKNNPDSSQIERVQKRLKEIKKALNP